MAKAAVQPISAIASPKRRGGRPKLDTPSNIDIHVGARVRQRRTLLGMSQSMLGDAIGLTFQQVQKYERGANRIGASRLWDISLALGVPVAFFFEELDASSAKQAAPMPDSQMDRRETLELVRNYYNIKEPRVRRSVYDHVKVLGQ